MICKCLASNMANFHPPEFVSCGSETQLPVGGCLNITYRLKGIFEACGLYYQVRVQPFINGRPFRNDRAFITNRSALPASVNKHRGVYKRSAYMTG